MISIPNPTISSTATYDAWNRLISVTDASTSITNDYDARGFRITETTGGVVRHYYYTPGWQCVEERTGTLTTPERQFVWGMRYIDDLVIRDRSTANNGSINERRYAMQDGNWNTVAICDITGSVGERYAYSAYGTPVFMTGAGAVQASSPIGFETLYAGYRWDNATPQMYYVRNRFLLPQVGTWNKRDPLGYVDGAGLYVLYQVMNGTDYLGLFFALPDEMEFYEWVESGDPNNDLSLRWQKYKGDFEEHGKCYRRSHQPRIEIQCFRDPDCRRIEFLQVVSLTAADPKTNQRVPIDVKKVFHHNTRTGQSDIYKYVVNGPPGGRCMGFVDIFPSSMPSHCGPWYGTREDDRYGPKMVDAPGSNMPLEGNADIFETCAICAEGTNRGKVYGCVEWGYKVVNRRPPLGLGFPAGKKQQYCADLGSKFRRNPSPLFNKAVERFRTRWPEWQSPEFLLNPE